MSSALIVLFVISVIANVLLLYTLRVYKGIKIGGNMEVVNTADGRKIYSFALDDDPETFERADKVLFKVTVLENDA